MCFFFSLHMSPQHRKDVDLLERVQRRVTKMIWGLEHLLWAKAERVGVLQPGDEKALRRPVAAFQDLKGSCKKDGDRLFSRACCGRTRSNGFKPREGRCRLNVRKKFFIVRVMKCWQWGGQCPIPGNIQGQAGRGSEQPGLVKVVPAHCREVELDDL